MAQRTCAARLGLRLADSSAKKKISSSLLSVFMRRSSSTSLAATDAKKGMDLGLESEMELKLDKEKSVHLCFSEWNLWVPLSYCQVVRPIRLDRYDDGGTGEDEKLAEAAYRRSKVNKEWNQCIRLGSRVRRHESAATHIVWNDPLTRPLKFHVSSPRKTKIKSLSTAKYQMAWEEIDGKIYCIGTDSHTFEVLDPENDDKWRTLDAPPFIRRKPMVGYYTEYYTIFLKRSKKILGWEFGKRGAFCFDATMPENGWIKLPRSLGDTLPFLNYSKPLVIHHNHHPTLGAFNLMFAYEPLNDPFVVYPFFISNNCDSFQSISKPIQLPELCSEYLRRPGEMGFGCDPIYGPNISSNFDFVDLGSKKFGLVLHKFFGIHPDQGRNKGFILLLTFEYDIFTSNSTSVNKDSNPILEIQTRLLGTRSFRYCPGQLSKADDIRNTVKVVMNGAFSL